MEYFYQIDECLKNRFRLYLNCSNSELSKKFTEIHRNDKSTQKLVLVIEAIKNRVANRKQFNFELKTLQGDIYAIKIDSHRFYTLCQVNNGFRELFISRYGRKQSQQNTKKLTSTIESIRGIDIKQQLR